MFTISSLSEAKSYYEKAIQVPVMRKSKQLPKGMIFFTVSHFERGSMMAVPSIVLCKLPQVQRKMNGVAHERGRDGK